MISIREVRWHPFFSGLNKKQMDAIAQAAEEIQAERGHVFFEEGETLNRFYLVKEGTVDITIKVPDQNENHTFADQLTRNLKTVDITASVVHPGELFGWSALVEPHQSTASAKVSSEKCTVIAVDCQKLHPLFEEDHEFAYQMLLKATQIIRSRLRDRRVELLSITPM